MIDWKAYVAHIAASGRDIEQLRTQLALLEVGQTGRCGPDTNYAWLDMTDRDKGLLRKAIARKVVAMMNTAVTRLPNS